MKRAEAVRSVKLWIGGCWLEGSERREIRSPFNNEVVAQADQASTSQMLEALAASAAAHATFKKVSRATRAALLAGMAREIAARRAEIAECVAREAGKPITLADGEVGRALVTFTTASEEAKRWGGDVIPIDVEPTGRAYAPAVSCWVPRGPILGITPFNFPFNLVAHKVAPALASGNAILIKSAPQTPGGAVLMAEIFEKVAREVSDARESVPLAAFQVVNCGNDVAGVAVTDPRIATLTFTGSTQVGWMLQAKAVGKRVALELGGNAGVIIHSDADLSRAATRCAAGGYGYAGQSCISVQRVLVQRSVAAKFEELLVAETAKTRAGDPLQKDTVVGPVIDAVAADRIMAWIDEAKGAGLRVAAGGTRQGNVIAPTILIAPSGARREMLAALKVCAEEVFAPVVVLVAYDAFEDAIAAINDSRFGLQAGVFTDSAKLIRKSIEELEVGGVLINEVPTYRADQMPYGGVKESGLGREGLRYAMEEYSERRTVVQWIG